MKKKLYWIILVFMLYAFFEASSLFALFLNEKIRHTVYAPLDVSLSDTHRSIIVNYLKNNTKYMVHSSTMGWTIKKNGAMHLYKANSQGIRASKEYPLIPPENIVRISSFGDSFTHCDDVENEDSWQEKLMVTDENLEVINFGVPGFGLDQAFLRYQEDGVQFNSHIVLIGFMSENICRNINVFRPFYYRYGGLPFAKPRFIVKDDKLVLLKNPMQSLSRYNNLLAHPEILLPELGTNDYYFASRYKKGFFDFLPSVRIVKMISNKIIRKKMYENIFKNGYYNEKSEGFEITTKLFDKFYSSAVRNKSLPIIVLFPNKDDITQYFENKSKTYASLLTYFDTRGYEYIDILNAFDVKDRKFKIKDLFVGHYSPMANELVAKYIGNYLRKKGLTNVNIVNSK
ncbi:MAG: SGNH/GDSL hydrolase family protein [Desulfobacteraceae bacterium]|nr:SGNH/GDSL hydrolase family protein [Desulfobacteraceae bacterium]